MSVRTKTLEALAARFRDAEVVVAAELDEEPRSHPYGAILVLDDLSWADDAASRLLPALTSEIATTELTMNRPVVRTGSADLILSV
jgi:hypothetical protein